MNVNVLDIIISNINKFKQYNPIEIDHYEFKYQKVIKWEDLIKLNLFFQRPPALTVIVEKYQPDFGNTNWRIQLAASSYVEMFESITGIDFWCTDHSKENMYTNQLNLIAMTSICGIELTHFDHQIKIHDRSKKQT